MVTATPDSGVAISCAATLTSDPKNCGACLHDCFGGACVSGACQPVAVAKIEGALGVACADDEIIVANGIGGNGGMLMRASVGASPVPIVVGRDGPEWPYLGTSHVYWLERGALNRTPRDRPGVVEAVVARPIPQSDPRNVLVTKLVEHSGNLYFAATVVDNGVGTSVLWSIPLAGGEPASLVTTTDAVGQADSLAVSLKGVFALSSVGVWTTPLAGGTPSALPGAAVTVPRLMSIGSSDTELYVIGHAKVGPAGQFVETTAARILRLPLDGRSPSAFYEAEPPANHLLVDARRVYFSNFFYDAVIRYGDHVGGPVHELPTLPLATRYGIRSIEQSARSVCAVVDAAPTELSTIFRVAKPL